MEISLEELRKLLNKAWDAHSNRDYWEFGVLTSKSAKQSARYRDVSKILKEAEKAKEEQP